MDIIDVPEDAGDYLNRVAEWCMSGKCFSVVQAKCIRDYDKGVTWFGYTFATKGKISEIHPEESDASFYISDAAMESSGFAEIHAALMRDVVFKLYLKLLDRKPINPIDEANRLRILESDGYILY